MCSSDLLGDYVPDCDSGYRSFSCWLRRASGVLSFWGDEPLRLSLHEELEKDTYMQQPKGFIVSKKEYYVCLMKKSIYSLKQSPRQWYKRFDSFMTSHDFKRNSFDSCVYFKINSDGCFLYLLLYVDDMLIATKDKGEIRKVKAQLSEEFEMKDLEPAKKILGM